MERTTERALRTAHKLIDQEIGIIQRVEIAPSPPDEPAMYDSLVERNPPDRLTDGYSLVPSEGGCSLDRDRAIVSAIGEAVERYCACIYREADLRMASYGELEQAVDPQRVINFSQEQIQSGATPSSLYQSGDELRWVEGRRERDGSPVYLPAQLVYLNYDQSEEPFVRNPISTGLAAGVDRNRTTVRAILEIIERDAFMIYYLTETELPQIDVRNTSGAVKTLTDRLDRGGITWHLIDARTDVGVPVVIAVLIADREPVITVAASAQTTAKEAARGALEEAIQTRLYQRHIIANGSSTVRLQEEPSKKITRDKRILGWADETSRGKLSFWTESSRTTTLGTIGNESNIAEPAGVHNRVQAEMSLYTADVTTRDVSEAGFRVIRAVVPEAQPLYLREENRYWDESRLRSVTAECGYHTDSFEGNWINDYPHPFP